MRYEWDLLKFDYKNVGEMNRPIDKQQRNCENNLKRRNDWWIWKRK
jgi:hypothetical protein